MLTSCSSRGDQPPGPAVRLPRTQKEAQTEERRPNAGSPDRVHALKINPLGWVIRDFFYNNLGGQAEATETCFGRHLARTDPFQLADSTPPDAP